MGTRSRGPSQRPRGGCGSAGDCVLTPGGMLCFPAVAHLLAELLDVMLHQGRSAATIATGLPWFSTFPSSNDTDFSQTCC